MTQPVLYMIAGPNGAGKTTSAMKMLPNFLSIYEFVNADEIARGLNPLNGEGQFVDEANVYDSSRPTTDHRDLIAGKLDMKWQIIQPVLWAMVEHQAKEGLP